MNNLRLDRPLAFFDLETTGTDPATDRIVEISVRRVDPDGGRDGRTRRVNPGRPIPAEATAIHGIRDEDVRDAPEFRRIARSLLEFLGESDLAGFNILRFDVPLLDREFREAGLDLALPRRRVIDAMAIFHRKEPRHLAAAVAFYLGREHAGAHGAEADADAALEVLEAQLGRYLDLPRSVAELDAWCRPPAPPGAADLSGKFLWRNGEVVLAFGKHQGKAIRDVAREHRDYLEWILKQDFPADARRIVEGALKGEFPAPPAAAR
ncbi:MAG: 3'-5' exonuclease [Acidobacteriia bacterium]|nr:3'-5' exonuclease [Terriglobia bacterium]